MKNAKTYLGITLFFSLIFIFSCSAIVPADKDTKTYSIIYNGNGNTDGKVPIDSNMYEAGQTITTLQPSNLEKMGSTFTGWNTTPDGKGISYPIKSSFAMGKANIILYAQWVINPTFTIMYNGNGNTGGTVPLDSNAYEAGEIVTVSTTGALVKTGATFAGWNTAANGTGTDYLIDSTLVMDTANITLYAQWTINPTFTVAYNGNGNTGGTVPLDSNAYEEGKIVTVSTAGALVKTGATFAGWNTAANGTGTDYLIDSTLVMDTANITLYAQWTINPTFTVAYNGNGNTGGTVPLDSNAYEEGKIVTVSTAGALVKTGYTLANWNTVANGTGTDYLIDSTLVMETANITLYAQWTINPTFTVTYNGNGNTGGTVPLDSNAYEEGKIVTVSTAGALVKTGYTLANWNTVANGTGTDYLIDSTLVMGTANITLYAQWTINPTFTVTYNGNGNTGGTVPLDSNAYEAGKIVTVSTAGALVKTGYTLANWNTVANGTGTDYLIDSTLVMGTANITLYAQWMIPKVATPIISLSSGDYIESQLISLSSDSVGAEIRYVIGAAGSTPPLKIGNGTLYTQPFEIEYTSTLFVQAFKNEMISSEISQATYQVHFDNNKLVKICGTRFSSNSTYVLKDDTFFFCYSYEPYRDQIDLLISSININGNEEVIIGKNIGDNLQVSSYTLGIINNELYYITESNNKIDFYKYLGDSTWIKSFDYNHSDLGEIVYSKLLSNGDYLIITKTYDTTLLVLKSLDSFRTITIPNTQGATVLDAEIYVDEIKIFFRKNHSEPMLLCITNENEVIDITPIELPKGAVYQCKMSPEKILVAYAVLVPNTATMHNLYFKYVNADVSNAFASKVSYENNWGYSMYIQPDLKDIWYSEDIGLIHVNNNNWVFTGEKKSNFSNNMPAIIFGPNNKPYFSKDYGFYTMQKF